MRLRRRLYYNNGCCRYSSIISSVNSLYAGSVKDFGGSRIGICLRERPVYIGRYCEVRVLACQSGVEPSDYNRGG